MKILCSLFVIMFCVGQVTAQNKYVKQLVNKGHQVYSFDPTESFSLCKQAQEEAQLSNDHLYDGSISICLARYYILVTNYELATLELNKAEIFFQQKNDKSNLAETYSLKSILLGRLGEDQKAILPPLRIVKAHLKDSFILYKPKDIVAGDFYWMENKNGKILFAAADCTGLGVPGAMVSVVCNNALNRSVREHGLTNPAEILNRTREIVVEEFEKSDEEVKDGMDIALCSIKGMTLEYAGAHNPLWIIRNKSLIEIKADKQPIGQFFKHKPFTSHTLELQKEDIIYIFSDGYADQFGGENGKKFKIKAFKNLLLGIQDKSMDDQKEFIDDHFKSWKGDLEQLDDVCVIGVKI